MDPLTIAALGAKLLGMSNQQEQAQNMFNLVPGASGSDQAGAMQRRLMASKDNAADQLQSGLNILDSFTGLSPEDKGKAQDLLVSAKNTIQPTEMSQPAMSRNLRRPYNG